MYDSELLRLIKHSRNFSNETTDKKINELLNKSNLFYTFYNRLETLSYEKSFDDKNEAKFILSFILSVCNENLELQNKLIEYLKRYGEIK